MLTLIVIILLFMLFGELLVELVVLFFQILFGLIDMFLKFVWSLLPYAAIGIIVLVIVNSILRSV